MKRVLALSAEEVARLAARGLIGYRPVEAAPRKTHDYRARNLAAGLTTEGKPRQRQWKRCGNSTTKEYHRAYMQKRRLNHQDTKAQRL